MPRGDVLEDSIVVSDSAAKKLSSEQTYQQFLDDSEGDVEIGKNRFVAQFPTKFDRKQLDTLDENGIVKPGTTVHQGDPLALGVQKQEPPKGLSLGRSKKSWFKDASKVWDHQEPGIVTDSVRTKKGVRTIVRSSTPAQEADKICYDKETDILTHRGWVPFPELKDDDQVAYVDSNGYTRFKIPRNVIREPYSGKMYGYSGLNLDYLVTPHHRMWCKLENDDQYKFVYAKDCYQKKCFHLINKTTSVFSQDTQEVYTADNEGHYTQDYNDYVYCVEVGEESELVWTRRNGKPIIGGNSGRYGSKGIIGCYDDQTQIYTSTGWKYFKDLYLTDEVAYLDEKGYADFTQPKNIINKYYNGLVYGCKSNEIDYVVTPDHRMWYKTADSNYYKYKLNISDYKITDAVNLHKKETKIELQSGFKLKPRNLLDKLAKLVVDLVTPKQIHHTAISGHNFYTQSYTGNVYCVDVGKGLGMVYVKRNGNPFWCGNSILPDEQMPRDEQGNPYEVLMSPLSIISRVNPSFLAEAALGKVARKTGKPVKLPAFQKEHMTKQALKQLHENGLEETERVWDPQTNRWLNDVFAGDIYTMKLHHLAETKQSARDTGGYDMQQVPARGGPTGSKRLGGLEMTALMSHGAPEVARDARLIRGQRNDEFWRRYKSGEAVRVPSSSFVFDKFLSDLKGAGVNIDRQADGYHLKAMTDSDVDQMAGGRELTSGDAINVRTGQPIKGGLMDLGLTGGKSGCFHPHVQIWTELGQLPIGEIVNNEMSIRVWTYNFETKEFELKPITNWFRNYSPDGIGRSKFEYHNGFGFSEYNAQPTTTLAGTRQHQVFDKNGDKHDLSKVNNLVKVEETPSYSQEQVILGSLLGDGRITLSGYFEESHSTAQDDYLDFKYRVLHPIINRFRRNILPVGKCLGSQPYSTIGSKTHAYFKHLRHLLYPKGVKTVTFDWLSRIDELGLMCWFMDDGSISDQGGSIILRLSTDGFTKPSVMTLQKWLKDTWGLKSSIAHDKRSPKNYGYSLVLAANSAWKFLNLIAPYMETTWAKVPNAPRTKNCKRCNKEIYRGYFCLECSLERGKQVGSKPLPSDLAKRFGTKVIRKAIKSECTLWAAPPRHVHSWYNFNKLLGTKTNDVLNDIQISYKLVNIPCEYKEFSEDSSSNVKTVYDIEVADNHNYFANGILVSNSKWSQITLDEPMPHPLLEEPIRRVLGYTQNEFKDKLYESGGPQEIKQQLSNIRLDDAINRYKSILKSGKKSSKNNAQKVLKFLEGAKKTGVTPDKWMVSKVPVTPPKFRPVTQLKDMELTSDANLLYKDLFEANKNLKELKPEVEDVRDERATLHDALKSVVGLGDPVSAKHKEKQVGGFLRHIFSKKSPKLGTYQRQLLSTNVDQVGRSVISPDPNLNMDQVGIPESMAWTVYRPHVMRRLARKYNAGNRGTPLTELAKWVENKDRRAKNALLEEMEERPVVYSRAPVLHKYGIIGGYPKLTTGNTVTVSPLILPGIGGDFDGDQMNVHVPASQDAIKQVKDKMLPSKSLYSEGDYDVHLGPDQDYLLGLHLATRRSKNTDNKQPRVFQSEKEVRDAFLRGEISMDTPVKIKEEE